MIIHYNILIRLSWDEQVEQYAFVLLAEAAKIFEDQGTNVDWKFALMTAGLALENGRLSESLKPEEAASLYKESGPTNSQKSVYSGFIE
jgi:hypothetical protein